MKAIINEESLENVTLNWFTNLNYQVINGLEIAPDGSTPERKDYKEVFLADRLKSALVKVNPDIPSLAIEEAFRKIILPEHPRLEVNNQNFHKLLTDGIDVSYKAPDSRTIHDKVWPIDFEHPDNNDFLAVNQFTVIEGQHNRRPDIVIFINGLPIAVIELKNPTDEDATIKAAYQQLQTYKSQISSLFTFNELLIISDGIEARAGSLTADFERFMPWRSIDGINIEEKGSLELETLIKGIFDKNRLLDLIQNFVVYEVDGEEIIKKVAAYHQYFAVNYAVEETIRASSPGGDKRIGVMWHTQGSGKSLSMVFFAGKIVKHSAMANPTLILLTDRNDLDNQLFDTFCASKDLIRQTPKQAEDREDLKTILKVASGGVIFTTIQKFMPENKGEQFPLLSERRNIIFIADEAHRSQYDFIDGFARHMRDALPNASFIGFTGTPIETADKITPAVFGNYIKPIYDIQSAVEDGATVKIYYEPRMAKIDIDEAEKPKIDPEFEEVTEGEEVSKKEKLKSKWARLEAAVGTPKRLELIAKDIVEHFEKRLEALDGKAMIVCMSRRICVDLYEQIKNIRPEWDNKDDKLGEIKVIMTGSASDPENFQQHLRSKARQETIKKRLKDKNDNLKIVIVRDMWLTGFDAPVLHTMYIDKPMHGHNLMQAIARVNRVFKDKPGGLIVDYLGIADQLKGALGAYTKGSRDLAGIPQEEAVAIMLEKYEIIKDMFHGFDYSIYFSGTAEERIKLIPNAMQHILEQEDGKNRYLKVVTELSRAFALSVPDDHALKIRDEVAFFQGVKAVLIKRTITGQKSQEELDTAIKQIVSRAVCSDKVIDIFSAAGLKTPDISILSDQFLQEVALMPQKNLAVEMLNKLLNDELKIRKKTHLVKSKLFSEMLEATIAKYQNRTIEAAKIISELIELAKEMREAYSRGNEIGLSEEEIAFYDALETNDSAVKILGDETLKNIARDLVKTIKANTSIDWTLKESVKAKIRVAVKRVLRKYDYPPDKQQQATLTVLEQAELLCNEWN